MDNKLRGKFIVLDGPDGCGKSTQLELLAEYLNKEGVKIVKTHDPGGTEIGAQIRRLLKYDAKGVMNVNTETMLFMASRAQLVAEVIKPAMERGETVLCDRFISSTCAYQGSSGYPLEKIVELGKFAVGNVWPHLTIIIDIPIKDSRQRLGRKPGQKSIINHKDANQLHLFEFEPIDRFDSKPQKYQGKVRKGFLRLEKNYPGIVKVIDGSNADIETVHQKVIEQITQAGLM